MIKNERQERILEILETREYITAKELSEQLFISMPTIRRDLSELAAKNYIIRSRGGARKIGDDTFEIPLKFRNAFKTAEKRILCKKAAEFIKDGDFIFLDASTSVFHITEFLAGFQNITVVTNSLPVAASLSERGINTFCTGGRILKNSLGFADRFSENLIENFNFDIMFFSARGANIRGEIVDTSEAEAGLRQAVFRRVSKKIFVCSSEKFGISAPYFVANLDDIDYIITDSMPAQQFVDHEKIIIP